MYSSREFKCVILKFVFFLILVSLCLNFYPGNLSLGLFITILVGLTTPFLVYLLFTHKKCVERQRRSLLKVKKDELTYQLICEWIKLKGNIKATNIFVDKMVLWSKDKEKKRLIDFNLVRDFLNSKSYYSISLHSVYSRELHKLDDDKSPSNDTYVKQRLLIERIEFLLPPKQDNAYI